MLLNLNVYCFSLTTDYKETKTLSYEIYVISDGDERLQQSGIVENNKVEFTWKAWPFATESIIIRVVFTDGTIKEEVVSNEFSIRNKLKIIYKLDGGTLNNPITEFV